MSKRTALHGEIVVRTDRSSGDVVISRRGQSAYSVRIHKSSGKSRKSAALDGTQQTSA